MPKKIRFFDVTKASHRQLAAMHHPQLGLGRVLLQEGCPVATTVSPNQKQNQDIRTNRKITFGSSIQSVMFQPVHVWQETSIYVKQEIAVESDHKPLGTIERAPLSQHHPDCRGYSSKCRSMTIYEFTHLQAWKGVGDTRHAVKDPTFC